MLNNKNTTTMGKKFFCFALMLLYVVGVIGGIGYSIMGGGYVIALGIATTGWLAWPKVADLYRFIMGD